MQFLSQKSNAESIDFAAYHVLWVLEHARLELNRYDKWSLCIWQRNEPIQDAAIATRFVYWHPPILTSRTTGAYRSQISMPRVPDGTNVAGITRTPFPEPGSNKPPKCIFWNLFELSGALVQRPPAAPLRLPIQGTWKHLTIVLVPYTYRTVCRYFQRLKRVFASLFVPAGGSCSPRLGVLMANALVIQPRHGLPVFISYQKDDKRFPSYPPSPTWMGSSCWYIGITSFFFLSL